MCSYVLYIWISQYFQGDTEHHFEKQTKIEEIRDSLMVLWIISIKVRNIHDIPLSIFRKPLYKFNIIFEFWVPS